MKSKEENSFFLDLVQEFGLRKRWVDHGGKHEKHRLTLTRSGEPLSRTRGTLTLPAASSLHLSKAYCLYLACGCLLTHFIVPRQFTSPPPRPRYICMYIFVHVLYWRMERTIPDQKVHCHHLWLYIKKISHDVSFTDLKFSYTFFECTYWLLCRFYRRCKSTVLRKIIPYKSVKK